MSFQTRVEYPSSTTLESPTPPALPPHQEWSPTPTVNPNKLDTYPEKSSGTLSYSAEII